MQLSFLWRYLRLQLGSLFIATVFTFLLGAVSAFTFALIGPAWQILTQNDPLATFSMQELFGSNMGVFVARFFGRDQVTSQQLWLWLPWLIIGAAGGRALLSILQWFLWERASELIARACRQDLVSAFIRMQPESRRDIGDKVEGGLAAHIGTDIRMIREYLVHFLGGFPRELVQSIFYIITLFLLDWTLALFFLLGLGPAGIVLSKLGKKLRKRSQQALEQVSLLSEWMQERLSGMETIKQFRQEEQEIAKMQKLSHKLFQNFVKAARVKARTSPLMELLAILAMLVVMVYGIKAIDAGQLQASVLLSFFSVLGILSQSAAKLGRYYNSNKEGEAAVQRLEATMRLMQEHGVATISVEFQPQLPLALEVKNLSYLYPGTNEHALYQLNMNLDRGKIYAIAGRSGSGKSTLLKLLLGLWKTQSGSLRYSLSGPHDIGYLPQSIQLAPASIGCNLSYPDSNYDQSRAEAALQRVGLMSLCENLPQALETQVGDGGQTLSGGQAQRLLFARLFYRKFPLVIIDEGTSALDPETESLVLNGLKALADQGSTVIMVAHRMSVLKIADHLFVLKRGQMAREGRPRELLEAEDWRELFVEEQEESAKS